jgi:7-dehydrocholesterol reductase
MGTWAITLGMPVLVTLWPLLWNGFQFADLGPMLGCYTLLWAFQWFAYDTHPVINCTALLLLQSMIQLQTEVTLPQLWPSFVFCGNVWGLFWSWYFYTQGSRRGNGIADWYSGVDLHPILDKVDLKLFIASRIGMQSWAMAVVYTVLDWAKAGAPLPAAVAASSFLQLIYIFRFFTWENEYLQTMDQQHDRAGFYVCWGCMAYIPALYWIAAIMGNPSMYSASWGLGKLGSTVCALAGIMCIYAVSIIDEQKTRVRKNPRCFVAGRPATYISTQKGGLLLTCGGWGVSRHLHYVFEIGAAIAWTAPVAGAFIPGYMYVIYLTILLVHRVHRDDIRCKEKYGADWDTYCKAVPYKLLPGVY